MATGMIPKTQSAALRAIDADTALYGVIGNPVGHSLSPAMHNAAFAAAGLNAVYLAFRVEDVGACLAGMRALPSFRGMSVTIPHKMAVMPHLDAIEPLAQRVGCVNTITNEHGTLIGSITDGLGTLRAFEEAGVTPRGKRVVFLGSGGAVRAVLFAVAETVPEQITLLGRTAERVEALAEDVNEVLVPPLVTGHISHDLAEAIENADVIIQGTSLGMHPHSVGESPIPAGLLRPRHVVFDMVYRPLRTRLLLDAAQAGCTVITGAEMLLNQAILQFERWTGQPAPAQVMRDALLGQLEPVDRT